MEIIPSTKTHKTLTIIWSFYALFCLVWLIGNISILFFPDSWIAKNNAPKPPADGWADSMLIYFEISMIASIIFPITFCFITLYGLIKQYTFSLFTGYVSLSTVMLTNLVYNVVTIKSGSLDWLFLTQVAIIMTTEILALVYLVKLTIEYLESGK